MECFIEIHIIYEVQNKLITNLIIITGWDLEPYFYSQIRIRDSD